MTERQGLDSGRPQPLTVVCHLSNCDHYLTVEQAAGHLELGQQALLDLLDRGELPAEKLRGAYRIPPSEELADMWSEAVMKRVGGGDDQSIKSLMELQRGKNPRTTLQCLNDPTRKSNRQIFLSDEGGVAGLASCPRCHQEDIESDAESDDLQRFLCQHCLHEEVGTGEELRVSWLREDP